MITIQTNNLRAFGVALHSLQSWVKEMPDVRRKSMRQVTKNSGPVKNQLFL